MRKNRASFFNDNIDYYNTPNPNMYNPNANLMPANGPAPGSQTGYYMNGYPNQYPNMPNNEDFTSRFAKLERQVNRLEKRVSNLEQNQTSYSTDDIDSNVNNMYMV